MSRRAHTILILYGILTVLPLQSQDLESDLKNVMDTYSKLDHFSVTLKHYELENRETGETITIRKCGEKFYTSGYGQVSCINGKRQVMLIPDEKIVVYSESEEAIQLTDPLNMIGNLLQSATKVELTYSGANERRYTVYSKMQGIGKCEISINTALWYVRKCVQYVEPALGGAVVYEVTKFNKACDAGDEVNLSTYCMMKDGTPVLTNPYRDYTLYNANDYLIRQ